MLNKGIIIAIDGWSSCGKSTLAKALAKKLNYAYIDTGAMYRACTYFFIQHQIDLKDEDAVEASLKNIQINFKSIEGINNTFLNGKNVEQEIRSMEVSNLVSPVAELSVVRKFLVKQQQAMGQQKSVVLDGRDIGTVVFPNAELKIFLTAEPEVRAKRRFEELRQKGIEITLSEVITNLQERDHIDSTRADSPLKQAEDAHLIDNTYMDLEISINTVLELMGHRQN
jgi:cytidylate kinase